MPTAALDGIDLADLGLFQQNIPQEVFARLRAGAPLHRNPGGGDAFWSLLRHADACAVNRDSRRFSSERRGVMMFDQTSLEAPEQPRMMIEIDPPRHTRYRRLVNRGFTPRMVGTLEPRMREIARSAADAAVRTGSFDFAAQLANRLPVPVICELTGVPASDQASIEELSDRIQAGAGQGATGAGIATAGIAEPCAYANRLADARRDELARGRAPDDIVTALLAADVDGQALSPSEFGLFFPLLAVAGNETTRQARWLRTSSPSK